MVRPGAMAAMENLTFGQLVEIPRSPTVVSGLKKSSEKSLSPFFLEGGR